MTADGTGIPHQVVETVVPHGSARQEGHHRGALPMSKAPRDRTDPKLGTPRSAPSECEPDGHLSDDQIEEGPAPQLSDWPLRSHLELGALPSAVPCARLHTKQVLWEWGVQALIDPAELIVSELVTTALYASGGLLRSA
jgi:hypothetical protein